MKIFLDTSSLVKLYHRETGTEELENLFTSQNITTIFLSEIAKIEFASTIWKKVRTKEITELEAKTTLELFETDFEKYTFIATDSIILETGRALTTKYGMQGLRTLDSIQFSTAISLARQADVFFTADKLLKSFFEAEGLSTEVGL
jgi:predicted nucleic acid-binding protein